MRSMLRLRKQNNYKKNRLFKSLFFYLLSDCVSSSAVENLLKSNNLSIPLNETSS
jgi:hypothetical protein